MTWRSVWLAAALVAVVAFVALPSLLDAQAGARTPEVESAARVPGESSYQEVVSILQEKCFACHSSAAHMGGFVMASYQTLMKGGAHGAEIVPGHVSITFSASRGSYSRLGACGAAVVPRLFPRALHSTGDQRHLARGDAAGQQHDVYDRWRNLAGTRAVRFDAPGLRARVLLVTDLPEKARKIKINVDTSAEVPRGKKQKATLQVIASRSVAPGIHWFRIQTPLGTSNVMALDVGALPEVTTQKYPADSWKHHDAQRVTLPAVLTGTINAPGDVNTFQFHSRAGQEAVFQVVASKLGSKLRSVLTLRDPADKQLAQTGKFSSHPDAVLHYKLPANGLYTISIQDQDEKAGSDYFYRLYAGDLPYISSAFPLGIEAGHSAEIEVQGANLDGIKAVRVVPPGKADWWTTLPIHIKNATGEVSNTVDLAVTNYPQVDEKEPNDNPAEAQPITPPVVINGRIDQPAAAPDQDYFRFEAQRGEHLVVDVAANRLGSRLDSVIDVLDSQGRAIPRATIRCLNETYLTLSDRDSRTRGYRFVSRTGFHENDYIMVGEELDRIQFIPDQPDADIILAGFNRVRTAFLGTTPEALRH